MVRFCRNCKRAVDNMDKFCRECGCSTYDSISYYSYYDDFDKKIKLIYGGIDDKSIHDDIIIIKEKVDRIYQKLFPPSVEGLKEKFEKIFKHDNEKIDKKIDETEENRIDNVKGDIKESLNIDVEDSQKIIDERDKDSNNNKEDELSPPKDYDKVNNKEELGMVVPYEVDDKLDALLQIDNKGQRDAVRYLIQKYAKNKDIASNDESKIVPQILSIKPKEDVAGERKLRGKVREKRGGPYNMYGTAIHRFIPDILEKIESSKDKTIRVRISDMAKQLGEEFVDKKPMTLYAGLKYALFDHNVIVEMGRLKSVDPKTGENIRVLKMRMKNPGDKLPPFLMKRREGSKCRKKV